MVSKNWWDEDSSESTEKSSNSSSFIWWRRKLPNRFYLKVNAEKDVVFIDEIPTKIYEHEFTHGGEMGGYATCVKMHTGRKCHLCVASCLASEVHFFTIVDLTGYKTRDGNLVKEYPLLLPVKKDTMSLLKRKAQRYGGLIGRKFHVSRGAGDKIPRVGDEWEYAGDMALREEWKPFDYKVMLTPFSDEDLLEISKTADWRGKKVASTDSEGDFSSSEDVNYDEDSK